MKIEDAADELLAIADSLKAAQAAIGADLGMEAILSGGDTLTLIGYMRDGSIRTALVDVRKRAAYIRD